MIANAVRKLLPLLCAVSFAARIASAQQDSISRSWNRPVEPFRIAGNLYYVGASDVTSFLITTPAGHIVIDGGLVETAPLILANIRRLGFRAEDVRILLNSHAHYDRVYADGEAITLGGLTMTARITPGHTPGCTTWTTTIVDDARSYSVAFLCSPSVPDSYVLTTNPRYPNAVADYRRQFEILRTLLQFGVTTVRDPGAIMPDALLLRRLLRDGELDGPRFFTAGRILLASNFRPPGFVSVHDEAAVRAEIRWQALSGVDVVKIYSSMPPNLVAAAIAEAHAHGLPVIGHLQRTTWTEAARMGIDGVEHAAPWSTVYIREADRETTATGMFGRVHWLKHLDDRAIDEMFDALAEHHVVVDPTLMATMQTKFWADDPKWTQNPDLALVPERVRKGWAAGGFTKDWTPAQFAEAKQAWPILLGLIKKMYDRGVPLVAGTDTPTPWIVPGSSLHDELKLLNEAGIPPLEVLKIATFNAARALRRENEFGSIRPGLLADLILLSRNPLEWIGNTRSIEAVIQNGVVVAGRVISR